MDIWQILFLVLAIGGSLVVGSLARGWWEKRKASLEIRLINGAQTMIDTAARIRATRESPTVAAQVAIDEKTANIKLAALLQTMQKLTKAET